MPRDMFKIIESKSKAAAANFNQANSGYRPPMVSNQIRPPGFPPIQNPHANSQNNFNRGNNFNQNRGNNFNQGQIYRPPVNQPVAHQGPAPQTHASTSGSGTLPGNTVTNPKEDLKGITTRSGVTIQGPKAVNHDTEVTKDTMPPANNGSTKRPTFVVQIQSRNPNPEPNVAPVVTPIPKASIPFPSRRNDERRKEKANDQIEKFYEIFRDLSFEISFTDALMLMPKFASTLKTLIGNKEKLSELARTPLNENCSAVILLQVTKNLETLDDFDFPWNLRTLIDVYEGEITFVFGKEDPSPLFGPNFKIHSCLQPFDRSTNSTSLYMDCDEYSQESRIFKVIGKMDPTSSEVDPTYQILRGTSASRSISEQ
ncbi:hypothetical protein Tco_0746901 [Tanacetum coccineum]